VTTREKDDETRITIQSLSDVELIQLLQLHGHDERLTQMVEAEIERRKTEGGLH
jgi:hypothetical protein